MVTHEQEPDDTRTPPPIPEEAGGSTGDQIEEQQPTAPGDHIEEQQPTAPSDPPPAAHADEVPDDAAHRESESTPPIGDAEPVVSAEPSDEHGADEADIESAPDTGQVTESRAGETAVRDIVVELKRVETDVRQLLADYDPRRKRKLAGTRRWLELQEDILAMRYAGRMAEESLDRLQELCVQRQHLFSRLKFLAGTRPTWNT